MEAKYRKIARTMLAASSLAGLGLVSLPALADQVPGYCGVILCSSGEAASFLKQQLELGDATLGWWDCRIQGKCQDLQEDIKKLKMDDKDCTVAKLFSYRKDIAELDTKLGDLVSKFGEKGREAVGYKMRDGLTGDLMAHFKQCYDQGLFKPDPNVCITDNCAAMVSEIEQLAVNKENCEARIQGPFLPVEPSWEFGYEQTLVTARMDAFKGQCVDANLIPATTMYGMPIFKKDLDLAKQCESMENQIKEEVANFQVVEPECATDRYAALNNQVKNLGETLAKLGEAAGNSESGWRTRITGALESHITQHFAKCEAEGLFPADKSQCLSQQCKEIVANIDGLQVDKTSCEGKLSSSMLRTPFKFEEQVVQLSLDGYHNKCIDANMLPATNKFGLAFLKKDLPLVEQCEEMQKDLASSLETIKVDAQGCSMEAYGNLQKKVDDLESQLEKVSNASVHKPVSETRWLENFTNEPHSLITRHFVKCESEGLFPSEKSKCLSESCETYEEEIAGYEVDEDSCKVKTRPMSIETTYQFEKPLVEGFQKAYREKCIDANFIPMGEIYDQEFYKKDWDVATHTRDLGEEIEKEIDFTKVDAENCNTEQYKKIATQLEEYESGLEKMRVAIREGGYWPHKYLYPKQTKLNDHYKECERKDLFPANKNTCLSKDCKEYLQKIEAFPMTEKECQLNIHSHFTSIFSFETHYLDDMVDNYREKCLDADLLDYKFLHGERVKKSVYLAAEKEMWDKIHAMGHHGETIDNSKTKLIPWKELVAKIDSLKVNKQECNFDHSTWPITIQLNYYTTQWMNSGIGTEQPDEVKAVSKKLSDFRDKCRNERLE